MARRLSALHVVASINAKTGGPAASVTGLAAALARCGVRTSLATLDYPEHGTSMAAPGVTGFTVIPSRVGKRLRGWSPALGAVIADAAGGVDVIHHHGLWMYPGIYARRAAVRFGLPLVISPRGMLDAWSLERSARSKAWASVAYERRNLRAARVFHATSEMEADAIRRHGLTQPIAVIPNGVEMPDAHAAASRDVMEARFPELRGRRWLLFMGRLHAKKGLDMLLDAWSALNPAFPDWHLVLAGPDLDGHGAEVASSVAHGPGRDKRVTLTGMIEGATKQAMLCHADLFVLPTRSENFGISVAEALAHGLPVVTTTTAPWAELESRGCGWWVAPEPVAITEALRSAMSLDPHERKAMGEQGRRYAADAFSWDSIGTRMAEVYGWIVAGDAIPACVRDS